MPLTLDRIVANVSLMFRDDPLPVRLERVRQAGVSGVEIWWPFSSPAPRDREIDSFVRLIGDSGLALIAMNLYAGNPLLGERGVLCLGEYEADLVASAEVASQVGDVLGCRLFNVPYGDSPAERPESRRLAMAALRRVCEVLARVGGTALLEPLTARGPHDGLARQRDAVEVITALAGESDVVNCGLLFDAFHAANNHEDFDAVLEEVGGHVRHVQLADSPGRYMPGTGDIEFGRLFEKLGAIGYSGYISCEYETRGGEAGFEWLRDYLPDGANTAFAVP